MTLDTWLWRGPECVAACLAGSCAFGGPWQVVVSLRVGGRYHAFCSLELHTLEHGFELLEQVRGAVRAVWTAKTCDLRVRMYGGPHLAGLDSVLEESVDLTLDLSLDERRQAAVALGLALVETPCS